VDQIERIIDGLIAVEGSAFTDDPDDSGGPTKYGVTARALGRFRGTHVTKFDVQALTEPEAREVYRYLYVREPGFDFILKINEAVGVELVDTGVNCGPAIAAEFLQRCLNALNRRERDYPDIEVDRDVGPATERALRAYLAKRGDDEGEAVLVRALNCLQGARYIALAEGRPKDEAFVFGWLRERVA